MLYAFCISLAFCRLFLFLRDTHTKFAALFVWFEHLIVQRQEPSWGALYASSKRTLCSDAGCVCSACKQMLSVPSTICC